MSDHNVDVCYLLSHGFAARMVLHTNLIPRIRERGLSVAVVVPSTAERAAENIEKRHGLEVRVAPDYQNAYRREYAILRRYLFEDVERNPALWPKHHFSRELSLKRRLALDAYLMVNRLSVRSATVRNVLHRLESSMLRSREAGALLDELRPRVVVATYPISRLESHVVSTASRRGIKTVGHLLSWDNITSKGRFPCQPDYYITWGPIMTSEVEEYYHKDRARIYECGVAHFDRHLQPVDQERIADLVLEHGLDPERPYLPFGMSSAYIAPEETAIVRWLARKVNNNEFGDEMQLIVRPHPQNIRHDGPDPRADELSDLVGPRVAINYPLMKTDGLEWNVEEEDLDRLVTLFAGSAVTMNSGSTFAIDGLMRDKPVIITAFDGEADLPWYRTANRILKFHHIRKLVDLGGCYVADSFESLERGIHRYLEAPWEDSQGRERARHEECGPCDGATAERIASALVDIMEGRPSRATKSDSVSREWNTDT
jgi:hypothetical protein